MTGEIGIKLLTRVFEFLEVYYTQGVNWKTITNYKLESETKDWCDKRKEHIVPGLLLKSIEAMHISSITIALDNEATFN